MKVESNILELSKAMFNNKTNWQFVTDEQKEAFFFIFNRYFSKRYPEFAQLLNDKTINKSVGLDLWAYFMLDKPYPQWFWDKDKQKKSTKSNSIDEEFRQYLNLKQEEIDLLKTHHPETYEEEINYFKLENGNNNSSKKLVHNKSTK
jgi:hypothetical protein